MKRKEAIEYLEKKGEIKKRKKITIEREKPIKILKKIKEIRYEEPKYEKKEEEKIKEVMKEGKIYGDPIARIQW